MILPIVAYGTPILRQVSKDITPDYPDLAKLIEDMWETMYSSNGVGLAAPDQPGYPAVCRRFQPGLRES